ALQRHPARLLRPGGHDGAAHLRARRGERCDLRCAPPGVARASVAATDIRNRARPPRRARGPETAGPSHLRGFWHGWEGRCHVNLTWPGWVNGHARSRGLLPSNGFPRNARPARVSARAPRRLWPMPRVRGSLNLDSELQDGQRSPPSRLNIFAGGVPCTWTAEPSSRERLPSVERWDWECSIFPRPARRCASSRSPGPPKLAARVRIALCPAASFG